MISADEKYVISLSNPFCSKLKGADDYGINIRLSPFPQHCRNFNKVILSADPIMAPDDYLVMVIYNDGHLAFIRPNDDDKGWTCIERELMILLMLFIPNVCFMPLMNLVQSKFVILVNILPSCTRFYQGFLSWVKRLQPMCRLNSDFPGCQPNSIYFTDRQHYTCFASNYDMSIFNLGDGSF
jgi:hypothetical protein